MYPLVKLPLIFHVPKNVHLDEVEVNLDEVIKKINKIYRTRRDSLNPNVADSYIEFYLATKGPDDKVLPQPGVNYLTIVSPTVADSARIIAFNVMRNWCPKNYLNVFVDVNFFKGYVPDGYSASFRLELKIYPDNPTCHELNTQLSSYSAIVLYNEYAFSTLAHELGHFMGLSHTIDVGCSSSPNHFFVNAEDTPKHLESRPSGANEGYRYKFSCEGISFYSTNVMDYHVPAISFTQDQVAVMQYFITHPYYLPL